MHKFLVISILALSAFGCATKGSVETLTSRVDALEANHKTLVADHEQIKSDHEAIKAEHAGLTSKLDNLFLKKNLK